MLFLILIIGNQSNSSEYTSPNSEKSCWYEFYFLYWTDSLLAHFIGVQGGNVTYRNLLGCLWEKFPGACVVCLCGGDAHTLCHFACFDERLESLFCLFCRNVAHCITYEHNHFGMLFSWFNLTTRFLFTCINVNKRYLVCVVCCFFLFFFLESSLVKWLHSCVRHLLARLVGDSS